MERVQTQFLICRKSGCSFGSVGLIFAHVVRFWDFGPALAPYWDHVKPSWAILCYFGICVGLCLGFGHFSVVEFSSMQGVCKKHHKYQGKNTIFRLHC